MAQLNTFQLVWSTSVIRWKESLITYKNTEVSAEWTGVTDFGSAKAKWDNLFGW